MLKKELIIFYLFTYTLTQQLPYPLMMPYNNGAYNTFFDGPNGQKGFWGQLPPQKNNIFNSDWKNNGYKQMYNMNSIAPFAQDRMTGYDGMMPYYTPMANSVHSYYPVLQKFNADGQIDPLNKDLNSKQYEAVYKQYHDFYGTDINRKNNMWSDLPPIGDLNNDHDRKIEHPESYVYDDTNYFDKLNEIETLPGYGPEHLKFNSEGRERFLKDINKKNKRDRKLDLDHDFDESLEEEKLINETYNMKKQNKIQKARGLKVVYGGKKKIDYEKLFDKIYNKKQKKRKRMFKNRQIV